MPNTYLFYDIESTGLNKCFDQVIQFAAIRTDLELNELERHEFLVKLNPDVIPAPGASITHLVSLQQAATGMSEYEAIQKIHAMLNQPGTISVGYNTLTFDDEFLRFSFWRNLLPPYTHQYANQCGRMDIYPMAILYRLFHPDVMQWPEIDGKPSMKLDAISALNQLAEGQAHNALVDVEATIALARKLKDNNTAMWDYLCGYFNKQTEQQRLRQLPLALELPQYRCQWGLMSLGKIGSKDNYLAPVLNLGGHNHYKNQTLWLRLDLPELTTTSSEKVDKTTWVLRKKQGEPGLILPPNERYLQQLSDERRRQIDDNLQWCHGNPNVFHDIVQYYREYKYPVLDNVDAQAILYQTDFLTPAEQRWCAQFHEAIPVEKSRLLEHCNNPILQELGTRILGRHYPESMSDHQQSTFEQYLESVYADNESQLPLDYRGKHPLSLQQAQADIVDKQQLPLSETQQALLQELQRYFNTKKNHQLVIQ